MRNFVKDSSISQGPVQTAHLLNENLNLDMVIKTLTSNAFKLVLGTKGDFY